MVTKLDCERRTHTHQGARSTASPSFPLQRARPKTIQAPTPSAPCAVGRSDDRKHANEQTGGGLQKI